VVLVGVALGFVVLTQGPKLVSGMPAKFLAAFLYWAIPLAALALLYWLCGPGGMGRRGAIVVATLIVAVLFAAEHLPTYNWNVPQALMGVGVSILTAAMATAN